MNQPNTLDSVAEFHRTFNHPILYDPEIPSKDRCELRISLISEELKELREAIDNNDLVEVADALCDLQYVLSGTILEFGLGHKFSDIFNEVQRSNMSKACVSQEEANQTMDHYEKKGIDSFSAFKDGKFLVYRTEDQKALKNINYSPANIAPLL